MKHKWEIHGQYSEVHGLYIQFDGEWGIVGWAQETAHKPPKWRVFCHWIDDGDYPESKVFETVKQARRALKAAATIAVVGGWKTKLLRLKEMERTWKFSMTKEHGPMWDMFEDGELVAYARRAKKGGWFVRISELNPSVLHDKIYIGEDTDPIGFMNIMLSMHKKETP